MNYVNQKTKLKFKSEIFEFSNKFIYKFFFIIFFIYTKMSKTLLVNVIKKIKKGYKKACERYQNLSKT